MDAGHSWHLSVVSLFFNVTPVDGSAFLLPLNVALALSPSGDGRVSGRSVPSTTPSGPAGSTAPTGRAHLTGDPSEVRPTNALSPASLTAGSRPRCQGPATRDTLEGTCDVRPERRGNESVPCSRATAPALCLPSSPCIWKVFLAQTGGSHPSNLETSTRANDPNAALHSQGHLRRGFRWLHH